MHLCGSNLIALCVASGPLRQLLSNSEITGLLRLEIPDMLVQRAMKPAYIVTPWHRESVSTCLFSDRPVPVSLSVLKGRGNLADVGQLSLPRAIRLERTVVNILITIMRFQRAASSFAFLAITRAVYALSVTSSSRTIVLGNISYFLPGTPVASFKFSEDSRATKELQSLGKDGATSLIPFSFITTSKRSFSSGDLDTISKEWSTIDDVWNPTFLQGMSPLYLTITVFYAYAARHLSLSGIYLSFTGSGRPSTSLVAGHGTSVVITSEAFPGGVSLTAATPPGPYFVDPLTGQIFPGT